MSKILPKLFLFIILFVHLCFTESRGQIIIGTPNNGPYGRGNSISVPITINPADACFESDNKFELFISDSNGNFNNQTKIGEFSGFYSTFINGLIPNSLIASDNYKLKVTSTSPVTSVISSGTIKIRTTTSPAASITANNSNETLAPEVFGWCGSAVGNDKSIVFNDVSSPPTAVILTLKNEITGTSQDYTPAAGQFDLQNIDIGYYTITLTATRLIAGETIHTTRSYLLLNMPSKINISTGGNDFGCIDPSTPDGALIAYSVNTSGADGIQNNYPGSVYRISWGDGEEQQLTHCELIRNGGAITHHYMKASCGEAPIDIGGGTQIENAFRVSVTTINPYCQADPISASTYPRIYLRPIAKIVVVPTACINTAITFTNNSSGGYNSDCSESMQYKWYVDDVLASTTATSSFTLPNGFSTTGIHTVKLIASNDVGACTASEDTKTICIQNPPQPSFNFGGNQGATACAPAVLKPTNTSIVDESCDPNTTYHWIVNGGAFEFASGDASTKEPEFKFNNPGLYKISLSITTASCGAFVSPEQSVIINTTPSATLSPNVTVCSPTTYDFNATTTGPTLTTFSGTNEDLPNTYTWTVSGGAYNFANGTDASTKYPSINFTEYKTYTVTVIHKNNCGTATTSQQITFTPSPKVSAGDDQDICHNDQVVLDGNIDGNTTSYIWTGGAGTFTPGNNVLNPVYTPTQAERNAGMVTLTLQATTSLPAPCNTIKDEVIIHIKPLNEITTAATKIICTGAALNYAPAATLAGSTFTWTATGSANAGGYTSGSGSTITDQLSNSDPLNNATVTYTITPQQDNCAGEPFTFTVTVTPVPVLTATPGRTDICNNQAAIINLSSNIGNVKYTWTSTVTGSLTGNSQSGTPQAATQINDVILNPGSTVEQVTYVITPISEGGCAGEPVTVTINVEPLPTIAKAGPDEQVCASAIYTLQGNEPLIGEGKWTLTSGQAGVTFTDNSKYNTEVSGLQSGQDYIFRWTISGTATCGETYDEVIIRDLAPLQNTISSTYSIVCNGQAVIINGDPATGGDGTYVYSWESSLDNGNSWTVIPNQDDKDLNVVVTNSSWFRRIVVSNTCNKESNIIKITAQPPLNNNTISADQNICTGNTPAPLSGTSPSGGDGSYNFQWQQSTDNGTSWTNIPGAIFNNYSPPVLTATTSYRRLVSTAACSGDLQNASNVITVVVNPNAKAEFTWTNDNGCTPFILNAQNIVAVAYPDRNASYTWYADNAVIGTGFAFPGYTISTGNTGVEIKLEVTSSHGCQSATMAHIFTTKDLVTASYTQDKTEGCGNTTVTFTNTTPAVGGAAYLWDFGNGNQSTSADPGAQVFLPQANARDTIYHITLTVTTDCGQSTATPTTVLVKAQPIPILSPDKTTGCSPLTVKFNNTSMGTADTYYFQYDDGSNVDIKPDKSETQHTFVTSVVREYKVTMIAENECGAVETTPYIIRVSPNTVNAQLIVNGNELEGCAPLTVDFQNHTTGASRSYIDFDDGTTSAPSNTFPETRQYTFTKGGTYNVKLIATNNCGIDTDMVTIKVYDQPDVKFTAEQSTGCPGLDVQFRNQTSGAVSYTWDFGDGSPASLEFEPHHIYNDSQEYYTVKLTAVSGLGCSNETSLVQLIHIVPLPVAAFNVLPSTQINIPEYTFRFEDESRNSPNRWEWDFGDGSTSDQQNPNHTYADTGSYKVTLRVFNAEGCSSTAASQFVRITGVPGYLYVPNSFIPGGESVDLREFKAKGSGIQSWRLSIFNKWGQLLWETTKLEEGRPVEGWDGTFNGTAMPQGVYFWKIDVQLINGTEWKGMTYGKSAPKRTGTLYLIR